MPSFTRDGLRFNYRDEGTGIPFVFQHGLGGDLTQPFELCPAVDGIRLLGFDCRGHGETRPLGDVAALSFARFADDLIALLDHLALERAIVGGISMGAGVALNTVARYPERIQALIPVRPAWLDGPMPAWARDTYAAIAQLIRADGAVAARALFAASDRYRDAQRQSAATAASLLGQFERPRAEETVAILERLPADAPLPNLDRLGAVSLPTLVVASDKDPVHPLALGTDLALAIGGAQLAIITSKTENAERHVLDCRRAMHAFLRTCTA